MELSEDGFVITLATGKRKVLWTDIIELHGYKVDLLTTDEIYLDVVLADSVITIPESNEDLVQLSEKIKEHFPSIDTDWCKKITHSPFATNFTVLYKREHH